MGEWMQRAAMIDNETAPCHQRRLSEPDAVVPLPEPCRAEPNFRLHPKRYEFPRFVIPTTDGPVEFHLAVPKEKYEAFAILNLFIEYHGQNSAADPG